METSSSPLTADKNHNGRSKVSEKRYRRENAYQMIVCCIANTSILGPAMGLGYSAVALGPLAAPESGIEASENEQSWIASITAIATPIGCLLSSLAMRRGRRFALLLTSVISATGWLIIYFSPNVGHILVGRAICGVALGLSSVPATVYAAEVAGPKLRGNVVTWTSVAIAIGILIVYTLGFVFQKNWRLVALICGGFPIVSIALVASKLPESPVWLQASGHVMEAEIALRKINGVRKGESTPDEYLEKLSRYPRREQEKEEEEEEGKATEEPKSVAWNRENLKPLIVMVGYFFFQQFSGTFVVIYYAVDFTLEAGVRIDGHLAAIFIGITRLFGALCVSYVSRKYGRRIPSIASGIGMTFFMGALSIYLWASSCGYAINDRGIIPVISILMYIFTSTMGFMVLPFAMIGEIYPARFRDVFSGLTTCLAYVFSFVMLKVYPDMLKLFDKHGVFLFYAVFSLIGTIFVALFLPETKGRTLQEIEDLFKKGGSKTRSKNTGTKGEKVLPAEIVEKEMIVMSL